MEQKVLKYLTQEKNKHFGKKKSECFKDMADTEVLSFYENWKECQIKIFLVCLKQIRSRFRQGTRTATPGEKLAKRALNKEIKELQQIAAIYYGGRTPT